MSAGDSDAKVGRGAARGWRALCVAALAAALALALANVWFGPLNQDEGWYLLAARNVARGRMPYRDFLYTQGPFMPYFYGALSWLWAPLGVLGGRLLTAALGLAAALMAGTFAGRCAARTGADAPAAEADAARAAGRLAALLSFVLLALSPDWSYFTAIPKTYALGAALLCAGFATLSGRRSAPALSGALFAAAAATRATLCLAAVPVWFALIADRREPGRRFHWLRFALGCAAMLALCYGPVLALCADNFVFSQTYHTAREGAGLGAWVMLRAGFVSLLAQGHPAMIAAAAALLVCVRPAAMRGLPRLWWAAVVAFAALTLAHLLTPFPYNDYNTPAMPLAAVALAVPLARAAVRAGAAPGRVGLAALAAALVFAGASPLCMKWVGGEQHLFWFKTDSVSALARLRAAGAAVRERADGRPLLTQDAYLAVEADVPVVPGLEMGPFSFFPELDAPTARLRHVHNEVTLLDAIAETDASVAAVSGYTFAIACPSTEPVDPRLRSFLIEELVLRFPEPVHSEERFGQHNTPLIVLARPE